MLIHEGIVGRRGGGEGRWEGRGVGQVSSPQNLLTSCNKFQSFLKLLQKPFNGTGTATIEGRKFDVSHNVNITDCESDL
uniref:Uncharacterized protein n=1 Tax=Ascaris lumbricoides TaxID=6252 RepID=A0A0M3IB66_ASCLU